MSRAHRTPGRIVWHELLTDSTEASILFYERLCGWRFVINEIGGLRYRLVLAGDNPVGGLIPLSTTAAQEIRAQWLPYVSVPNVDLASYATIKGGGRVMAPPRELEPVGRFAVVADPGGATLALWRSTLGDPPEESPALGGFCWDQLNTTAPDAAVAFYQKVVTWHREPVAGDDGRWLFKRDELERAGLVTAPAGTSAHWLSHVWVPDLDRARQLTADLGGQVLVEEVPLAGIGRFSVIEDNVGAQLALFAAAS